MTPRRIYKVIDRVANETILVDASSQAVARSHVVAERFKGSVATAREVVSLMSGGSTIEVAGVPREQARLIDEIKVDMGAMEKAAF